MLVNYLLFWMMIVEGVICLLISLPVGKSLMQSVIRFLSKHIGGWDSFFGTVGMVVLALVALLFLSDVHTVYRYHLSDTHLSDGIRLRLLTAQRDMYITGFCLFLFLLLRLVYESMSTGLRLEKSLGAMKKQAEGASTGYKTLLEENEKLKAQLTKLEALTGEGGDKAKDGKSVLAQLLEENAALSTKLDVATKEVANVEAKIEVVKKQAEGQSAAFMKLMDEKADAEKAASAREELEEKVATQAREIQSLMAERDSLKSQVQDYDFMFADAKKKAE